MRFVLIHGGFHGAWCWERFIPELEALGHEAIAIDLPGHGLLAAEPSTLENRTEAITRVLQKGDVLVGHSGGGYDITLAANAAPEKIGHLIYLAAGLPIEGLPLVKASGGAEAADDDGVEQLNETIIPDVTRVNEMGRIEWVDFEAARQLFYHDVDEETARRAFARFSAAPQNILVEPVHLPAFWEANLPRSYIICEEDRALPFKTAMTFAGRLGVFPKLIGGSHSPFISRPKELAQLFTDCLNDKPLAPLQPV